MKAYTFELVTESILAEDAEVAMAKLKEQMDKQSLTIRITKVHINE